MATEQQQPEVVRKADELVKILTRIAANTYGQDRETSEGMASAIEQFLRNETDPMAIEVLAQALATTVCINVELVKGPHRN